MNHWRVIRTAATDGPMNMAIDQAIMEAVADGRVPPTLRLYDWTPACFSLGYTQPLADVNRQRLAEHGWDLVRRLTGGRAILHTDELTYSVAVKADHPIVAGDIVASYRRLSQALLLALQRLGADPQADKRITGPANSKGPVCFEVPSHYEITLDGKKLVGSAQVRKFNAVLQHGSLPLYGDITRICDALVFESAEHREHVRARVRQRATSLEASLGRIITWEQAADAVVAGFLDTFDLSLEDSALTPDEETRASELRAEQYATESWHARF